MTHISYEDHGADAVEGALEFLGAYDAADIEDDSFEVIGEDDQGREGYGEMSIVEVASEGAAAIRDLRAKLEEAEKGRAAIVADALDNLLGVVRCSGSKHLIETVETNIKELRRRASGGGDHE